MKRNNCPLPGHLGLAKDETQPIGVEVGLDYTKRHHTRWRT
jgi:hypothetical protein